VKIKVYGGRDRGSQAAVQGFLPARAGLGFFETNENRLGLNRTEAYGISANVAYHVSCSHADLDHLARCGQAEPATGRRRRAGGHPRYQLAIFV
jgi:hypothetical protein